LADIYTSSGNIADTILAEEIDRRGLVALQEEPKIARLVAQYDLSNIKSKSYSIPVLGTVTPSTVGETADLTSTAFATTENTITRGEIGWMTLITDTALEVSTQSGIAQIIAAEAGKGIGRKWDTDLAALFPALNGGTMVGNFASTMSVSFFLSAIYNLELNNVRPPFAAVLAPIHVNSLRAAVAASQAIVARDFFASVARVDGFVGELYGVNVIQSNQLGTGASGGTTSGRSGAMMGVGDQSPLAIGVWRPIRTELERDASRRAWESVSTSAYGVKEIRDKGGIGIKAR
jgi:hypothetical protein